MSPRRKLYLDTSVGERRGVVTLNDQPERLIIERDSDTSRLLAGAVLAARIIRVEKGLGIAFLQSPDGEDLIVSRAALPEGVSEGKVLAVQVLSPSRRGKGANAKVLSTDSGPPRWIGDAPDLRQRLQGYAPGAGIETGRDAREMADEAMAEVFQTEFPLRGGGSLAIESTRALIAVDVDVGAAAGQDARFSATKMNQVGIVEAARLARLKGLGGLMIIDLAGKGHNGPLLVESVKSAFAPDQPGVAIGAISRFGVLELALPWRSRPLLEVLADESGGPSVDTEALTILRAIEREAGAGRRVAVRCSAGVADRLAVMGPKLAEKIGNRFSVTASGERRHGSWEVSSL